MTLSTPGVRPFDEQTTGKEIGQKRRQAQKERWIKNARIKMPVADPIVGTQVRIFTVAEE